MSENGLQKTFKLDNKKIEHIQAHTAQRAGDHVCGYVRDSAAHMITKTYNQRCIPYMYGLMTVDERLGNVSISTHTAGSLTCPEA